jgi:hypothetical protein
MSLRTLLFGEPNQGAQFNQTLSTKIKVNDRVRHRVTQDLGVCFQTGTVTSGRFTVPAISVRYDNGNEAWMLSAEEFMKATKY